jgi:hypothetical protein
MTTLTLTIPFEFTHEYGPDTEAEIPVSKGDHRLARDLKQNAPSARFESKLGVVRTTLDLVGVTHTYLKDHFGPDTPQLVADGATSSAAHTALLAAATDTADRAAPLNFVTDAVRFVGSTRVEQDLEARDSFARVTWSGQLEVTWAPTKGVGTTE